MIKAGISLGLGASQPLASLTSTIQHAADAGFTHVELISRNLNVMMNGDLNPVRLEALTRAIADAPVAFTLHGSEVSSSRGGNLMDITTSTQIEIFKADLALAKAIGAGILVYHSGTLREPGGDPSAIKSGMAAERDRLRILGDLAGESGITIAVENRDPVGRYIVRHAYGISLSRLAEQVSAIDHPQVGVCLDFGHGFLGCSYLGVDFLDEVRNIAPLVSHIHLSDNFGKPNLDETSDASENLVKGLGDLHLIPGWGVIPHDDLAEIPFPRHPIANLEMRANFFEHLDLAAQQVIGFATRVANTLAVTAN